MATGGGGGPAKERLRSWKEIAAHFGTDERTVKRWAAARGLPVQRVPGGTRTPVYADVAALDAWLKAPPEKVEIEEISPQPIADPELEHFVEPPKPAVPRGRLIGALVAFVAIALLLAAYVVAGASGEGRGARQPDAAAQELYLAGRYQWQQRTPESLAQAVQLFSRALARDPDYADAYAGLANSYLLLREYTGMPPEQAYPLADAAAQRALALDPHLSDGHAALAFSTFFWKRDFAGALRGFERAVALDGESAHARHWYGTALLHLGDRAGALEQLSLAQRLDPHSRSILADRGLALFYAGRSGEAVAVLNQVAAAEPNFLSPHAYLAAIHLAEGRDADFLREAEAAARLRGDRARLDLLAAAARGLASGGRTGMLTAMAREQERLRAAGQESHYALAGTYTMLGRRDLAFGHLTRSVEQREPLSLGLRIDAMFRSLHADPAFARLADRLGSPPG